MKAFIMRRYGKKVPLYVVDVPEPTISGYEVLVQIHATAVNVLDAKIKSGEFKPLLSYRTPLILGHDLAGTVLRVGQHVKDFKVGDEVYARPADYRIGTFAQLIAVHQDDLALKPSTLSMEQAASIPLVGLTAWQALIDKANLQKGQKVFIQAGSGGVGTFAIQLAKHLGATVATTAGTSNVQLVKDLGADIVIDYKKEDFEKILRDYDVVLHSQDAETLEKSLRILKPGGKLISISGPPDPDYAKQAGLPWFIKIVMGMLSWRARASAKRQQASFSFLFMKASGKQLREISQLVDSGIIRPVIDRVFPFESTNEALEYVEQGRSKGKVVIRVK